MAKPPSKVLAFTSIFLSFVRYSWPVATFSRLCSLCFLSWLVRSMISWRRRLYSASISLRSRPIIALLLSRLSFLRFEKGMASNSFILLNSALSYSSSMISSKSISESFSRISSSSSSLISILGYYFGWNSRIFLRFSYCSLINCWILSLSFAYRFFLVSSRFGSGWKLSFTSGLKVAPATFLVIISFSRCYYYSRRFFYFSTSYFFLFSSSLLFFTRSISCLRLASI